ncbi:MAG: hormogonium polysaccharide biosynthesis protein HpsA [Nodosilinea sp.]
MRRLIKQIWQLPQAMLKRFVTDILRLVLLTNRPGRLVKTGFVLPTTVLLTLMVVLTVTALTYRSFVRSNQAINQREQQVIVNAATPAIDRAKAKIEFLFRKDNRLQAGLPSSDILYDLMSTQLGTGNFVGYTGSVRPIDRDNPTYDPYTLPDETRIDINGDKVLDNAWTFKSEGNTLVYSILVDDEVKLTEKTPTGGALPRDYVSADLDLKAPISTNKAKALVTRSGPVATTEATPSCQGALSESGWQVVNSELQKNFQIDAFVANDRDVNRSFTTLEFQQARQAARGNKWGAWFRYDLELFPGPAFNWNGALHSDSNLILHRSDKPIHLHMVSAPSSCVYSAEASEITLGERDLDGVNGINPQTTPAGKNPDFQGQVLRAFTKLDQYTDGDGPNIHLFNGKATTPLTADGGGIYTNLNKGRDSVDPEGTPSDVAVNPLVLFTQDETQHINPSSWKRPAVWDTATNSFGDKKRILNDSVTQPYVDDFYRADNRWGPKPKYDKTYAIPPGKTIGDDIGAIAQLTDESTGLDGYWERQATQKGLRLIVGQRLELGNTNGWGLPPSGTVTPAPPAGDPLYPANGSKSSLAPTNTVIGGDHEYLQRKALRDNLAAVQGMVVYHYEKSSGAFPAACVALTAHPGTRQTIVDSRTFSPRLDSSTSPKTNFLRGKGTNGWEFQFPSAFNSSSSFGTAFGSGDLRKALTNLAYFAGDPDGGSPSFKPEQGKGGVVHPFPYLSMWGDFSVLRRILDSSKAYADLSPADQVTLHSAACTLGLIANNLQTTGSDSNSVSLATTEIGSITPATWQTLAGFLKIALNTPAIGVAQADSKPADLWIANVPATVTPVQRQQLETIADFFQVLRDREFGFVAGKPISTIVSTTPGAYVPTTGNYDRSAAVGTTYPSSTTPYKLTCDPNWFIEKGLVTSLEDGLTLALALCPKRDAVNGAVKYPSLYYLFPLASHGQSPIATPTLTDEEYLYRTAANAAPTGGDLGRLLVTNTYDVVNLATIAVTPRSIPTGTPSWTIPASSPPAGTTTLSDTNTDALTQAFVVNAGTTPIKVPFLDKGIYDGREQLNTRVLDIDLDALTTQKVTSDYWLSASLDQKAEGVVYAFREDGVREDEIVRPKNTSATFTAAYCSATTGTAPRRFRVETDAGCLMRAQPGGTSQDLALTDTAISAKPVDFIADPERRVHGFRLRTASGNPADFSGTGLARQVGMTLVTPNPVYIMGDFNLHSTDGRTTGLIEEFTQTLQNEALGDGFVAPFYNRTTLNTANFANLARDHWRPVEILADAISIVSRNFKDGAVEDGFLRKEPGARGGADSSYMNQNRPRQAHASLLREDGSIAGTVPAYIDRNGTYYANSQPFYNQYTTGGDWLWFMDPATKASIDDTRRNNIQTATTTYVNAVFISGIVPKRPAQTYGGLHNFPRLLEHWDGINLNISGAFLQLNFATTATGPFEQDAWEPGQLPLENTDAIGYYSPPNRRWGYDVGLLYVPPAPIARRFVTFGAPRSEYYREVAADDPYILNLRCARDKAGNLVRADICPA